MAAVVVLYKLAQAANLHIRTQHTLESSKSDIEQAGGGSSSRPPLVVDLVRAINNKQ